MLATLLDSATIEGLACPDEVRVEQAVASPVSDQPSPKYPALIYIEPLTELTGLDREVIINWRSYRGWLQGTIKSALLAAGATQHRGHGTAETGRAPGDTYIIEIARIEPPMTPDAARKIGEEIVATWRRICLEGVPRYCDHVSSLPTNRDSDDEPRTPDSKDPLSY